MSLARSRVFSIITMSPNGQSVLVLPKSLNFLSTLSLYLGIVVGSGIFLTAFYVAELTPCTAVSIFIWGFCGIMGIIGVLSYIELACSFPESGSDFIYIQRLVHPKIRSPFAFCRLWIELVAIRPGANAAVALTG